MSLRESKNMTREEVSERSGLSLEQIRSIEEDQHLPSLGPLIKVARALGVRLGIEDFFREADADIFCIQESKVQEGQVELDYGKEKYTLNPGDSIYYDSIVKHHLHGAAGKQAKILAVVYIPF